MIVVRLSSDELSLVAAYARNAAMGGISRIRSGPARANTLVEDQQVGQLGEAALSKYLTGDLGLYAATREVRDAAPHEGDQGGDLLGWNVDVKTSVMRRSKDPHKYRLLVRPAERTKGTVYVLALVESAEASQVVLVGWIAETDLPDRVQRGGIFEGAFVVPAALLHPLPPFQVRPHA